MNDRRIIVTQGEQAVSKDRSIVISTLLGSCVACCIWDELAGVGGMNHMLLTGGVHQAPRADARGVNEMELLINEVLKKGGVRARLQAKAFGGAKMLRGMPGIGAANSAFTLDFLERENIPCVAQSLGGTKARHLLFWPATGAAKMKFVRYGAKLDTGTVAAPTAAGNGLELL